MLIIGIIAGALLIWLLYGYLSNYHLVTTTFTVPVDESVDGHTFVHLSDLHCCRFGKDNQRLLAAVESARPEAVFITGDMVTKNMSTGNKKVQRVLLFLETLCKKYPVYYADGNHEIRLKDYAGYREELSRIGVRLAVDGVFDFPVGGINLYALELPITWFRTKNEMKLADIKAYIDKEKSKDEAMSILLAHDPGYFETYAEWGADLSLSGHLHGGILRLPVIGGVFSPYLRLFPRYDAGMYEKDGRRMIVSRGLGTHHVKLRWFNPPEMIIIKLRSK